MNNIKFVSGSISLLDRVSDLWKELNDHHVSLSTHFSESFARFTFETRKMSLMKQSGSGPLLVEIAVDCESNKDVGYCISAVNSDGKGEVESIFIKPTYRKSGIGDTLMVRAIKWLDLMQVSEKIVAVAYGNEKVFGFYAKYGFLPRITVLRQKSAHTIAPPFDD